MVMVTGRCVVWVVASGMLWGAPGTGHAMTIDAQQLAEESDLIVVVNVTGLTYELVDGAPWARCDGRIQEVVKGRGEVGALTAWAPRGPWSLEQKRAMAGTGMAALEVVCSRGLVDGEAQLLNLSYDDKGRLTYLHGVPSRERRATRKAPGALFLADVAESNPKSTSRPGWGWVSLNVREIFEGVVQGGSPVICWQRIAEGAGIVEGLCLPVSESAGQWVVRVRYDETSQPCECVDAFRPSEVMLQSLRKERERLDASGLGPYR